MRRLQAIRQLAAMTATLALAGISHAQYGGPPGGGGGYGGGGYGGGGQGPHWNRTVSSTGTSSGSSGLPPVSSGPSPWQWPEGGYITGGIAGSIGTYKNSSMTGTVTYTYTWSGAQGTAPKYVVYAATGSASWHAPKINGSGSCDVTVSGDLVEETPTTENSASSVGGSISKSAFKVMDSSSGTVTVTVGLSSTVHAVVSEDPLSTGGVTQGVSASCELWSVVINVSGTKPYTGLSFNPDDVQILIGQKCAASLALVGNVSPANTGWLTPVELYAPDYGWTVNGDRFGTFQFGSNTGKMLTCEEQDQIAVPPTNRWKTENPSWYWKTEGNASILGKTKVRRILSHALVGPVELTRNVVIRKPEYQMSISENPTSSWIPTNSTPWVNPAGIDSAIPPSGPFSAATPGIVFSGWVWTPDDFSGAATAGSPSSFYYVPPQYGSWDFGQTIASLNDTINGAPAGYSFNQYKLDNTWPYANGTAAAGGTGVTEDSPSSGWTPKQITAYSTNRNFEMFMLYTPPGVGSHFVPLKKAIWKWAAEGTSTRTYLQGNSYYDTWQPYVDPGDVTGSVADTRVFPKWFDVANNGQQ
jgi:hypothetical protein